MRRASLRHCGAAAAALAALACGAPAAPPRTAPPPDPALAERARVADFERVLADALDLLAAADPRLAMREGAAPSDEVLERVGMDAILAEDSEASIRGTSLDLFAFAARARALDRAAAEVAGLGDATPETAPPGAIVARPRLERERLARLIAEEQARAADEARLGDASGALVRGIVSTWTPPRSPKEWPDRDAWVSERLREIGASLRGRPQTGPLDLDVALYPLERLLAPLQFPKGAAAIAELRVAIDGDMRAVPPLVAPERVAREAKVHLGVDVDPAALAARLPETAELLRARAVAALDAAGAARPAVEARARQLLLAQGPCPPPSGTRVGAMGPPPERAAVCGVLGALAAEPDAAAAAVALHDDVLLALAAITRSPPPRTGLLSHPDDDAVDAFRRDAREQPVPAVGVALAAELLLAAGPGAVDARARAWIALGDAPLDIVARELAAGGR